ncbi:MAG: hypothetical protein O2955_04745 [Planctomycetota bacterium]|nr:hypothetical protein [Planctomycetota bacterium]
MPELTSLDSLSGSPISETQIVAILAQIDLDIMNLLRDGKLAALKYSLPGHVAGSSDRGANLQVLIAARHHYERLLQSQPGWQISQYDDGGSA